MSAPTASGHRDRVVVGSCGDDAAARLTARALLIAGREVVFVGGDQTPEQLARTAQAEDASTLVVDGNDDQRAAVNAALTALGAGHVQVRECDQPDTPHQSDDG